MKKLFVILALLSVFLAACDSQQAQETSQDQQIETQELVVEETAAPETTTEVSNEMLNLAKALETGQSVKCTTSFEGQTSVTYWKNDNMRMDTETADAHGIYTKEVMYTWSGKDGVMMKLEDIERMAQNAQGQTQPAPRTKEDIVQENVDVQCEPFSAPDSMFVPPSDVNFQDMSEVFKQLEGMNFNIPTQQVFFVLFFLFLLLHNVYIFSSGYVL